MEDLTNNSKKPLRTTSNKVKDLYNTYIKNEGIKNIPITDMEEENKNEKLENDNNSDGTTENVVNDEKIQQEYSEEDANTIIELSQKISDMQKEKNEIKDQLVRKVAEMENVLRRTQKEKLELIEYANEKLLAKFVELLDDITKASEVAANSNDYDSLLKGLNMIRQKCVKLFEEAGVKQMEDPTGKEFDVNYHEALMHTQSEVPENHVVQELQPGYMYNGKVLRYAKVITSAGNG